MATTLNLTSSFSFTDPNDASPSVTADRGLQGDGIAFNPSTGNLFVVRTDAPTGPASTIQSILEFTANGTYIGEFDFGTIGQTAVGGTVLPNGNLLVVALNPGANQTFATRLVEVAPDGTLPTGGINLALPAEFNDLAQRGLVVGVTYSPAYSTNNRFRSKDATVLVITSGSQEIVELDLVGNIVSSVDLSQYGVTAPQGLAINPVTGNIFVADEATTSGGTNKIYEISPLRDELAVVNTNTGIPRFGSLVSIIETSQKFGLTDPEGLAFTADGSTLYAVFDGDDSAPTTQLSLDESFTFDFSDGEGLAFRALDNSLFVLQASTTNGPVWTIYQYDTAGNGTQFTADLGAFGPQDITVRSDNGNLILSGLDLATFQQRFVEIDPSTQAKATNGIDFSFPAGFTSGVFSGVFYNPTSQTLFGTDYLARSVVEFDPATGTVKTTNNIEHRWNVGSLIASQTFSPQAITYDATTGHYFLAGDVDSGNLIYEVDLGFSSTGTPTATLYEASNTEVTFGIQDAEGLAIDPNTRTLYASFDNDRFDLTTFGAVTVDNIGTKVARATLTTNETNQVVEFELQATAGIPTLKTIDKFGVAGQAINLTVEDFTTIPPQNFAPSVPAYADPQGDALASITILSLPVSGTLTLNGVPVELGDVITVGQIPSLTYTPNAAFSGVDTLQVSASDGTTSSAPAHIDFFVSSPTAQKLTATNTFHIDLGVPEDDRFNNSADGLVFNPVNGKVYTASSFRINPTDASTIGWRLIESNPDGSEPWVILQSEAPALAISGQTPFTPLAGVPVLDLVPNDTTDGVQDLGVVLGTGTARDGNILVLSTRGASIFEITPDGTSVAGGINISAPGLFESGGALSRSAVGMLHTVENGQEYIYVTDFGERLIRKVPARTGTIASPAILTTADVISEIKLQTALPEARLQGITIDPLTGNFFVADDASGNAAIYEINPNGTIVGSTDMLALGQELGLSQGLSGAELTAFANKFADLEGITIDPATRTLYAAIDDDGVGQFGLAAIGRQVVTIALDQPPAFAEDVYEFSIQDDAEEGDDVGEPITATDADGDTLTYSITAGNDDLDEDTKAAFAIDTSTGQISVNDADDVALGDVFNLTITATDPKGLTDTTDISIEVSKFEQTATLGIFSISSLDIRNLVINAANILNVNVGIFFVDDALGSIGTLKPGDDGYLLAAAGRSLSLLAALSSTDNLQAPGQLKKVLGLKSAASLVSAQQSTEFFFGFLSVQDVSIGDLFAIANDSGDLGDLLDSISLSTDDGGSSVEEDSEGGFSITLGGLTFSVSFDSEAVEDSFGGLLGIDLDGDDANDEIVDEVIAQCDTAGEYTISGSIFREAAYNNTIGFFLVNAEGAILDSSGNEVETPDDLTNYKAAIVANLITFNSSTVQYQVEDNTTIDFSFNITTLTAEVYVLPVLAVQGDFSKFTDIYYPIIAANKDKKDHIKFQGAGATGNGRFFGFEDLQSSISDNDFDDFIIQVNVAPAPVA